MLVATIIDSCSLLKRDLTADSSGYSSKHYYYSPGNLDAFALRICSSLLLVNTNFKKECNSILVPPLCKGGLGGVEECCTILEKWYKHEKIQLKTYNYLLIIKV